MRLVIWIALVGVSSCTKDVVRPIDIGTACQRNADCQGNLCLPIAAGQTVCTANCTSTAECPHGWTCEALSSGGSSLCDCTPAAEICDGLDNDCNGIEDEGCPGKVDLAIPEGADLSIPPAPMTDKVDVLFIIDDSPSVMPVQAELKNAFPTFASALAQFPGKGAATSFHIGVITSDLGAAGTTIGNQCVPGGRGGRLQALGRAADPGCAAPTGGVNFISIDQMASTDNLPSPQTLEQTFVCMASVGDTGCGFEMPLEAAYRALHDPVADNHDFLRDDALLVLVWVTNEDDCSAPDTSDLFEQNNTQYGQLLSYRCTNYGVMCGDPPQLAPYGASGGPLPNCQAATTAAGGKLFEVGRYVNYFTKAGGVKANPLSVLMTSLAAPPTPFETFLANPVTLVPCAGPPDGVSCAVQLKRSCMASATVFGDPAVRISQVLHNAPRFFESNVCGGSFSTALQSIADAILQARLGQ
jgi:hypothetical protein